MEEGNQKEKKVKGCIEENTRRLWGEVQNKYWRGELWLLKSRDAKGKKKRA